MKKILSNKILQIICLTIFVAIIGVLVYTSTGTVKADDNVNMKIYNERNKEVDTIINELTDKIKLLEENANKVDDLITKIETLENTNQQLNNTLNTKLEKINTLEKNIEKLEERNQDTYDAMERVGGYYFNGVLQILGEK